MIVGSIQIRTRATHLVALALPHAPAQWMGGFTFEVPRVSGIAQTHEEFKLPEAYSPNFDTVSLYTLEPAAGEQQQPFIMHAGYFPYPPEVDGLLVTGEERLPADLTVHAQLPVGGADGLPLLVAVANNPSTGYRWEMRPEEVRGLVTGFWDLSPATPRIGAPLTRVYHFNTRDAGRYAVHLNLYAPGRPTQPASTVFVHITADQRPG